MRRLLFVLLLPILAAGCGTTSEVGFNLFAGTYVTNDWGTGGEIYSHFSVHSRTSVEQSANGYCAKRGLAAPSISFIQNGCFLCSDLHENYVYKFECNKPTAQPVQQQNPEVERLRAEAEASRQRQRQLEEQLNQARQPPSPSQPVVTPNTDRLSLDASKVKCTDLGFKPGTEAHGKCVLQLSK